VGTGAKLEDELIQLRSTQEHDGEEAPQQPAPKRRRQRVLLVDGSALVRKVVGELIKRWGHELIEARDGEEALAAAHQHNPHLILLDLKMPKKNGLEVLRELRADAQFAETQVVILTNMTNSNVIQQAQAERVDGYIVKEGQGELRKKLAHFLQP
tara:strand:+ start:147 stop:611 length:465 start_codon:yes stop_codon:yes gene_type:complete